MNTIPNLFITGAESFVGKRLVKHCKDKKISYSGVDVVASEDSNISKIDICDADLSELIPFDSVVIHLAAISRDPDCAKNPSLANKINIEGTLNVLRSAKVRDCRQLIFASSEWVYGQVSNDSEQRESDELHVQRLDSIYAITKAVGEHYLRLLREDLAVTILRFGIIYGPRPSNWSAVESLFNSVKNNEEVVVGSLKAGRRFIHVDDICAGILAAVGQIDFEIFNISSDVTLTLGQVIEESRKIHGTTPRVIESSPEKISLRNPSNLKAKQRLNWSPLVSLSDGLKSL
jgi:nucleoside-diphosphate-sugar epimerase